MTPLMVLLYLTALVGVMVLLTPNRVYYWLTVNRLTYIYSGFLVFVGVLIIAYFMSLLPEYPI